MLELNKENKEHEKRAHALRLLYKQTEMGHGELPKSYSELQEKVAALITEDLRVVEKALEFAGGAIKLGELDNTRDSNASRNADEQFEATVLGNE